MACSLNALHVIVDVLEYLLERPDASIPKVSEFLEVYEEPYKVTPTSGKYLTLIHSLET